MLKYLYQKEVFREIPTEVSLGISISGCKIHCSDCNQKELWEDRGTPLTIECVERLLQAHKGVTCLLLLGGEHDIDYLTFIFQHFHNRIKTAWYCGLDKIPNGHLGIVSYLDYLKLGHYDNNLGGLTSPTTNQQLYKIEHRGDGTYWENNITFLLQSK